MLFGDIVPSALEGPQGVGFLRNYSGGIRSELVDQLRGTAISGAARCVKHTRIPPGWQGRSLRRTRRREAIIVHGIEEARNRVSLSRPRQDPRPGQAACEIVEFLPESFTCAQSAHGPKRDQSQPPRFANKPRGSNKAQNCSLRDRGNWLSNTPVLGPRKSVLLKPIG